MDQPLIGREALSSGALTRGRLRWNYRAQHPRVYVAKGAEPTLWSNTVAAWLWTERRSVIAGRAAAALHGARWVDASTPIEVIAAHGRPRPGVIVREERLGADEVARVGELPVTTPARTAFDLARHLPRDRAVQHLDALAAATGVTAADALVLAERYRGARGTRRARVALHLMDGGAQSPRETSLRLLLIDAGLPAPRTQIRVADGHREAFIDMGYDEPMVGLDYEGAHHATIRGQYVYDIGRAEFIERQGWIDLRVVAEHSRQFILHRVHEAFGRRGWTPPPSSTPRS
ncbi:type IV toxin-antitoxin system AbiEi family antitoxin [Mycolicibacterium arseniciresistens]|uniref:Type IV toxin-antitoxin system AbiEi family antitoxin n=1 Tax=Mycolicibacterium arseniciresistens TaxID=3062257 RepID=A0ABT8UH00_9MYCO|nr:type IV toxin-antitoxin system AbiEi family antitoxin [Mycolicibacterium arseniciresistens]MDO3635459.1 type IV toxin-antitoxin system AbiEi family antitoxin [Mycolicibacterium arseniciresistens]